MGVVKNFVVRAGADFSELEKELKNASKSMKKAGKELSAIGKNMTMGITAPIVAAGGAAFKMAAEMEDAMGATNQIFGKSASSMQSWAKDLKGYYGIASGEALEYGNMMGSMLQNIGGLTEDEAAKQSQALITLAGDLTAMYGGTTQDAVRALTGALKGNNTMLDNYGMAANDAMVKSKALEMGLISEGESLDLASKQAATLALIMDQSSAAQGQAAREAEGASGTMRAMTTELKNLATSFGTILLPILTPIITKIKEMVEKFGALDEGTKKNIVTALLLAAAIGPVMMALGGLATGIGSALAMASKFTAAIKAGQTVLSALGVMMGPAGLVMIGILAFAAAAFLVIKNWDSIKAFFSGLGETVKDIFEKMKGFVLGVWDGITSGIKGYVNSILKFVNALIGALNKIKVDIPSWVPGFGGKSFGINIPKVPYLAEGGIVNKPTLAMIGEAGPEAVVPLDKGMNAPTYINLTVDLDGRTIARQTFEHLRNESKVRGLSLVGGV